MDNGKDTLFGRLVVSLASLLESVAEVFVAISLPVPSIVVASPFAFFEPAADFVQLDR